MFPLQIGDGIGDLGQGVGPADDRPNEPGFNQAVKFVKVLGTLRGQVRLELLGHHQGAQKCTQQSASTAEPTPLALTADQHQSAPSRQQRSESAECSVPGRVNDDVVAAAARAEVFAGVVDNLISTEIAHQRGL